MTTRSFILSAVYAILKMISPEVFWSWIRAALEKLEEIVTDSENQVDDLALPFLQFIIERLPDGDDIPSD